MNYVKMSPLTGMIGYGGGPTGIPQNEIQKVYVGYCFDLYWSKFGAHSGTGVWTGANGSKQTDQCSNNQMSATNAAWVTRFDGDTDSTYDQWYFSNHSITQQNDMAIWASNSNTFASGNVQIATGDDAHAWPSSNSGEHSLIVNGTRYRYWQFQNFPSWTYTVQLRRLE